MSDHHNNGDLLEMRRAIFRRTFGDMRATSTTNEVSEEMTLHARTGRTIADKFNYAFGNDAPLVSVVIVAYNSRDYIDRAIESVIAQTFTDFEIVVQDDCSTDDTVSVVKHFQDCRIRLFQNPENLGIIANSNLGIVNSRGKFVVRLDADDFLLNRHLELCTSALTLKPSVSLVYGTALTWYGNRILPIDTRPSTPAIEPGKSFFLRSLHRNPCISCATLFRREAFFQAGQFRDSFFASPIYNDYSLWLRLSTVGDVAFVREPIAVRVRRENSVSDASHITSPKRQHFRYLENTIEEIVGSAAEKGFLNHDEVRNLQSLLARRWLEAAERCALLPEHCFYCLRRAWEVHPLAFLRSKSLLLRISIKRILTKRGVALTKHFMLRARGRVKYGRSSYSRENVAPNSSIVDRCYEAIEFEAANQTPHLNRFTSERNSVASRM